MDTHYGLSDIEYELMQFFWENDQPLPFADVLAYCNGTLKHGWAATTLHTYLTRMIQKGVLASSRKGYKRSYYAKVSETQLSSHYANRFLADSFGGSLKNLLLTLTSESKLTQAEVDELKQILDTNIIDKNK
ncbi:MAG: BlaI/MecI/CopY family transcriptional regulator [Lachnospiraceae bacterium]|nr:BlaI/MecI/CopY family transcriptional regulator [Lachnospiraceae bacterium]